VNTDTSSFSFGHRGSGDGNFLDNPALYDGVVSRRFWAYILDAILIALITVAIHVVLFTVGIVTLGILMLPALAVMAVVSFLPVAILYDTLTAGGGKAATPGMRAMGIELQSTNSERPNYAQAFVWSLLFYVSFTVTSGLILLLVFFTKRNAALHDILTGAVVTRR
jgi:uncharacterized RDD family membrane protein YckC